MSVAGRRLQIADRFSSTGVIGPDIGYGVSDYRGLRVVVENAGVSNVIVLEGKLSLQTNWTTLKTITGNSTSTPDITTYEQIRLRVTTFEAGGAGEQRIVIASFFNGASGGDAFNTIDCPAGTSPEANGQSSLSLTSTGGSVIITGDEGSDSIDFAINIDDTAGDGDTGSLWSADRIHLATDGSAPALLENGSGSILPTITPIRFDTNGELDTIDVSDAEESVSIQGVTLTEIAIGGSGEIQGSGVIRDINSGFSFGDILYISKTGGLTSTRPQIGVGGFVSGDSVVKIGGVAKNPDNGTLKDLHLTILHEFVL